MNDKRTIWYSVGRDDDESRYPVEVCTRYGMDASLEMGLISEACARDFHSNHDGWDASWPQEFRVYETEEGPEVARFIVDRDFDPTFVSRRVELTTQQEVA